MDSTGFLETAKAVMTAPTDFFKRLPRTQDPKSAVIYGTAMLTLGIIMGILWQLLFSVLGTGLAGALGGDSEALLGGGVQIIIMGVLLLFSPIFALIGLFIGAGTIHLGLMLLGGNERGFSATLIAVAYSSTPNLLNIVPIVGGFAASVWIVIHEIIGIRELHGISTGKAAAAVCLPMILCCCCVVAGIGAAIAIPAAMIAAGAH